MLKHYVEFYAPGMIFPETWVKEVGHRDPAQVKMPKNAYAFMFYDQTVEDINGERLVGPAKNRSPQYLIGKHYTLEQARAEFPDARILLGNMERNDMEVVLTPLGNFAPFKKGDVLIGDVRSQPETPRPTPHGAKPTL